MRILVVTDNRFWRRELGSHHRIAQLCESLAASDHVIEIFYTGVLYPPDLASLQVRPLPYPLRTRSAAESIRESSAPHTSIGRHMRQVRNIIRQSQLELSRRIKLKRANLIPSFRRFRLQMLEPKLADFESTQTLRRFQDTCQSFSPEVVLVEFVRLAWILKKGARALPSGCLKLIDTHDVQHERQTRFHRQGEQHEIDISAAEEAKALRLADAILAIQTVDAEKFRQLVPDRSVVVVGVAGEFHTHVRQPDRPVRIGFFGSAMRPNQNAVERLTLRIFPALRERHGENVELHIFGGICAAFHQPQVATGIQLRGYVRDLVAAYDDIDIVATPVEYGGGLNIKNVEALCHGRPLVTTSHGAEGFEQGCGSAFWVASSDADFVQQLDGLLRNAATRASLGDSALAFARQFLNHGSTYGEILKLLADWPKLSTHSMDT